MKKGTLHFTNIALLDKISTDDHSSMDLESANSTSNLSVRDESQSLASSKSSYSNSLCSGKLNAANSEPNLSSTTSNVSSSSSSSESLDEAATNTKLEQKLCTLYYQPSNISVNLPEFEECKIMQTLNLPTTGMNQRLRNNEESKKNEEVTVLESNKSELIRVKNGNDKSTRLFCMQVDGQQENLKKLENKLNNGSKKKNSLESMAEASQAPQICKHQTLETHVKSKLKAPKEQNIFSISEVCEELAEESKSLADEISIRNKDNRVEKNLTFSGDSHQPYRSNSVSSSADVNCPVATVAASQNTSSNGLSPDNRDEKSLTVSTKNKEEIKSCSYDRKYCDEKAENEESELDGCLGTGKRQKKGALMPNVKEDACPTNRHPNLNPEKPCICLVVKRLVIMQSKPVIDEWHARVLAGSESDQTLKDASKLC
ncbi:unnamed protein product [Protopolystoma xenopodis]|uniref:Uncharacterized protein n=1 Tax=Protopolystoma xenopodis TaxID=117903 RepID=A0A3S5CGJ1_9PLAT|nr:unnamed protein product [Protopolystoma xenopodis]